MSRIAGSTFAIALAAVGALLVTVTAAEAQQRRKPMVIKVQPRSYFDAGRIPLGSSSYNRQLGHVTFQSTPAWVNVGERFGEGVLPPRVGAGENAFGRF